MSGVPCLWPSAGSSSPGTKLEVGIIDGRLSLCDEVLTPDSSRFWLAADHPVISQDTFVTFMIMNGRTRVGLMVAILALIGSLGCAKTEVSNTSNTSMAAGPSGSSSSTTVATGPSSATIVQPPGGPKANDRVLAATERTARRHEV